jgi:hypothetical protein
MLAARGTEFFLAVIVLLHYTARGTCQYFPTLFSARWVSVFHMVIYERPSPLDYKSSETKVFLIFVLFAQLLLEGLDGSNNQHDGHCMIASTVVSLVYRCINTATRIQNDARQRLLDTVLSFR